MLDRHPMQPAIVIAIALAAPFFACTFLLSCGDSPTEPVDRPGHAVYLAEGNASGRCYLYYPETERLDSLTLPYDASAGLYVSPRGEYLVACNQSGSIGIINATSLQVERELFYPHEGGITFAPKQEYLILLGRELNIVSLRDYALVFNDTISCWAGQCNVESRYFFFASKDTQGSFVGSLDLDAPAQESRIPLPADSIVGVAPSDDGQRLFLLMLAGGWRLQFHSFDVGTGKSTYIEYLWPPDGVMTSDPQGRFVFFNGAGDTPHDPSKDRYFRIFDVAANRVLKMISTVGIADGLEPQAMLPAYMAVTADGKWLIAGDYKGGSFLSFNINTMEVDRYVDLSPTILTYYTCRTQK